MILRNCLCNWLTVCVIVAVTCLYVSGCEASDAPATQPAAPAAQAAATPAPAPAPVAAPAAANAAPQVVVQTVVNMQAQPVEQPAAPAAPAAVVPAVAPAPAPAAPKTRNAAIFVVNRAGDSFKDKVKVLEDLVTGNVTELGFGLISREDAVDSIATALGQNVELDRVLSEETSRLRLAQNMAADYLLVASITAFDEEERTISSYGVNRTDTIFTLTLSYKILDKYVGASLDAGVVESTETSREDKFNTGSGNPTNRLLKKAAVALAGKLQDHVERGKLREAPQQQNTADLTVVCRVQDMIVPDIVRNDKGEYMVSDTTLRLSATNVTVIFNGAVIGTAPGTFKVPKGLSKIRLTRDGCREWEQNIAISDVGASLNVDLQMTDAALARWAEVTQFVQALKLREKLTDAQVERIKGHAQMLRQSGYKVDVKIDSDLKGTTFQTFQHQSIWN